MPDEKNPRQERRGPVSTARAGPGPDPDDEAPGPYGPKPSEPAAAQTAPLLLEQFLPYRLNRAAAASSAQLSRVYRGTFGLTIPEWRVLATLGQFGETTATAIGRHSSMHKTKVSRAVAALEARRWLARRRDTGDRRIEHLCLTNAGRTAYRRLVPRMLSYQNDLLARLAPAERAALLTGLAALERALASAADPSDDTAGDIGQLWSAAEHVNI